MDDANINIEEIMNQIRQEIRDKGYKDEEILFDDVILSSVATPYNMQSYKEELEKMVQNRLVLSYRDVSSDRKVVGPILTFFKKLFRRMIAFYIEPIVDDQNLLNECSTTLYAQIFNKFAENEEKISELEKELYDCKKRCMALEDKLKETK
jgi:hypothetical protein